LWEPVTPGLNLVSNFALMFLDIDAESLKYAQENITRNDLKTRIRLMNLDPSGPLIPLDIMHIDRCKNHPPT